MLFSTLVVETGLKHYFDKSVSDSLFFNPTTPISIPLLQSQSLYSNLNPTTHYSNLNPTTPISIPLLQSQSHCSNLNRTAPTKIYNEMFSLKSTKSSGYDKISVFFLKAANLLATPPSHGEKRTLAIIAQHPFFPLFVKSWKN